MRLRVSSKDRILFAKRLGLYLQAGIPILEAIDLVRATSGSKSHARLLDLVARNIQEGLPLSWSLSQFPRVYAQAHIQILVVGEQSGSLSESLSYLAEALEQRAARTRSIAGTLAYPAILLIGSLGISVFLVLYAFPKIIPLFRGLHATLPFTTRTLLFISELLRTHGSLIAFGFALLGVLIHRSIRIPRIKQFLDMAVLRAPIFGALIRAVILASIFRTIAILLASGIRLDEALRIAQDGTPNGVYRGSLGRIRRAVLDGRTLSAGLNAEISYYPAVAIQLVSVGEMTGTLSRSVASIAHIFDEECSDRLRTLSSILEPSIMAVMGLIIGFIAMAIISPMYGITQSLTT